MVISADEGGFVEYWQPSEPFEPPKEAQRIWNFKSATDLYEFKKVRSLQPFSVLSPHINYELRREVYRLP